MQFLNLSSFGKLSFSMVETASEGMTVNTAVTLNSLVHRRLIDAFYLATPDREAERCFDNLLLGIQLSCLVSFT